MKKISLPQFKTAKYHCVHTMDGPNCKRCRSPLMADWRERETGMRDFPCPFDPSAAPVEAIQPPSVPIKAAKASPDVVEARLSIRCDKRAENGTCMAGCASCKGKPTCFTLASWRHCPFGHW